MGPKIALFLALAPPAPSMALARGFRRLATVRPPTRLAATVKAQELNPQGFIDSVNVQYESLHRSFEQQFWGTKMALASEEYSTAELGRTKQEMEAFLASEDKLKETRALLAARDIDLTEDQRVTLQLFERTFKSYIMESETARQERRRATELEGQLERARNDLVLGAHLPTQDGASIDFVEMSSVQLRAKLRVDASEEARRACWEGLRKIGDFALEKGFLELVKARNAMAKELGYEDYYDYKVTQAEGFGKRELFRILDGLEEDTRPILAQARAELAGSKGPGALEAWNTAYATAGDVAKQLDPFFPFERAVQAWGRSFANLGIGYRGATMDLDLLDRKRKYSNGFCHWPQPAWRKSDGSWQPSTAHFTSLADPTAVGSGLTALTTLMHEAGHAAHFANIDMPSPLFSQERAPTSVPYAELQSMFLDSLVGDGAWRARYAKDRSGAPMPWDLHKKDLEATHPFKVFALRAMLAVPYFEKRLYELGDSELTKEKVADLADQVEQEIQGGLSARPLLSVPHLLSDEASCYYHGYVLAEMAVHQTRAAFMERDGYLVDNPDVGPTLRARMWAPGNSRPFLALVEELTGSPLTGEAWVKELGVPLEQLVASERGAYQAALLAQQDEQQGTEEEVDLDMRVRLVDGDEVIADTQALGGSFTKACARFEDYIHNRFQEK